MEDNAKPIAKRKLILYEEFDGGAILLDPDNSNTSVLNPIGVYIWKKLDGRHTLHDILKELQMECLNIPDTFEHEFSEFIKELEKKDYVSCHIS